MSASLVVWAIASAVVSFVGGLWMLMTAEERRQAWKTWLDDMFDWLSQWKS